MKSPGLKLSVRMPVQRPVYVIFTMHNNNVLKMCSWGFDSHIYTHNIKNIRTNTLIFTHTDIYEHIYYIDTI